MKLSTLKNTLDNAKSFLATQDFIAVLQHFAFDKESVIAYNDIAACRLELESNLCCTVPGTLLLRLLNTLSGEEVSIEENDTKTNVNISCGRSKSKVPMLPFEDFVFQIPTVDEDPITIPAQVIDGIRRCLTTVSVNPTRPEFNGINVVIESDQLNLYSSDGLTVSHLHVKDTFSVSSLEQVQVILPAFFCERLTNLHPSLAGKTVEIPMQFSKQWATAELGPNTIFTRVIDRKPPQCDNIISKFVPDLKTLELWDIPTELEAIVNRAILFLDPQAGITMTAFSVNEDEVEIKTVSKIGTSLDTIQLPVKLGKFNFSVDPNLLARGFKICKKMTLKSNVIVMQNDDFLHIIATK